MTEDEYVDVVKETAIYPGAQSHDPAALAYVALGLSGEAGEVANKIKKILRGDKNLDEASEDISAELGDVLWYIYALGLELGVDIKDLRERNASKLLGRKARGTITGDGDNR